MKNEILLDLIKQYEEIKQRATGRTTRIVDETIQKMFNNPDKWIFVCDHYPTRAASQRVVELIKGRLKHEHNMDVDVKTKDGGYEVKIKNYKNYVENIDKRKQQLYDEIIEYLRMN